MLDTSRRLRIVAPLGAVIILGTVSHVPDASAVASSSRACASANAQSSGATSAHSHSSSQAMSGTASVQRADETRHDHGAPPHDMSSSVEAEHNGLTSTTRMPDGSTVTVTSGQGTSKANVGQSERARSNASSSAGSDDDCRNPYTAPSHQK